MLKNARRVGRAPSAGLNRFHRRLSRVDRPGASRKAVQVPRVCLNPFPDTPGGHRDYTYVLSSPALTPYNSPMVIALLLSLLLGQATTSKPATAPQPQPTTPAKPTTTAKPAPPRTTAPRPAPAGALGGFAITVTDSSGTPLEGVTVQMSGVSSDTGTTNSAGQLSFPRLRAGTYRLRFSGDGVVAFEREVTLKAGDIMKVPVTLTAAEPPKPVVAAAPPPPPPPPAPVVGPSGSPQIGSVLKLAENERRAKERREILLSCSGNTRNMLLVLVGEQSQRVYDSAESTFYVLEGQGGAQVGGLMSQIGPGSFVSVPRGTPFTLARQGNRPLSLIWTLSGEPCEKPR